MGHIRHRVVIATVPTYLAAKEAGRDNIPGNDIPARVMLFSRSLPKQYEHLLLGPIRRRFDQHHRGVLIADFVPGPFVDVETPCQHRDVAGRKPEIPRDHALRHPERVPSRDQPDPTRRTCVLPALFPLLRHHRLAQAVPSRQSIDIACGKAEFRSGLRGRQPSRITLLDRFFPTRWIPAASGLVESDVVIAIHLAIHLAAAFNRWFFRRFFDETLWLLAPGARVRAGPRRCGDLLCHVRAGQAFFSILSRGEKVQDDKCAPEYRRMSRQETPPPPSPPPRRRRRRRRYRKEMAGMRWHKEIGGKRIQVALRT